MSLIRLYLEQVESGAWPIENGDSRRCVRRSRPGHSVSTLQRGNQLEPDHRHPMASPRYFMNVDCGTTRDDVDRTSKAQQAARQRFGLGVSECKVEPDAKG